MPNWFKRVSKERSQDIQPGETLRAATYYQGFGSASAQIAFGMTHASGRADAASLAGEAAAASLQRTEGKYHAPEGSLAAALPNPIGVLAVTDQRVLVFGYKQAFFTTKILDPVVTYTFEELTGWAYSRGSLVCTVSLAFSDGSSAGIEIPRINKPDAFAETLGIPKAG